MVVYHLRRSNLMMLINTYQINSSGTYVERVENSNDCKAIFNIEIEFIYIEIPNFYTPKGVKLNEHWFPKKKNTEGWPEIVIKVYNRYGKIERPTG